MKHFAKLIFLSFFIIISANPAFALKVTSFTVDALNYAHVIVAFDDIEKSGYVSCIFKNKSGDPLGKVRGYIDGVGTISKSFPLGTKVSSVICKEK